MLYKGFTLGMTHKAYLQIAEKTGFKSSWVQNMTAVKAGTWSYMYWDQKSYLPEFGDLSIQVYFRNKDGQMYDDDTIVTMQYDFGSYGSKEKYTAEEIEERFKVIKKWLVGQFGNPAFANTSVNDLILIPGSYHYADTGLGGMRDDSLCAMWIVPLDDGGVISIISCEYSSYGIYNRTIFTLYDKETVDGWLETI